MKFRSKFEETVFKTAIKNNCAVEYEPIKIPYTLFLNYIGDFRLPNGIIVETKGYFPSRDQVKMKAVKASNPGLDIRFVFMNAKTSIRKGSKTTYGDWANKNGFPFSEKSIPLEWWQE